MQRFTRLALAAALTLALPLVAGRTEAQSPPQTAAVGDFAARLEAAQELFALMTRDMTGQVVAQLSAQVWPSVETSLRTKNPGINAAVLAELRTEFERIQLQFLAETLKDAPPI